MDIEKRITKGLSKNKFKNAKGLPTKRELPTKRQKEIARGIERWPTYPDLTIHGKTWKPYKIRGV